MIRPSRRAFLAGVAALLAAPRLSWAFGDSGKVDIVELDLGDGTLSRPNAWERLLYEVIQTTSVECVPEAGRLQPDDPRLFEHPFAVIQGDGPFAPPGQEALQQLARYLAYGGFLFFDDTSGAENSGFDRSVRALVDALFPTRPLSPLPADHSLYRAFFLIDQPHGRLARFPYLEGVTVGNITPVVYSRNDLSGALDRDATGRQQPVVPGGEWQRREAVKLGVNLMMYSLTANYKKDQAHVRQLMLRGRIE